MHSLCIVRHSDSIILIIFSSRFLFGTYLRRSWCLKRLVYPAEVYLNIINLVASILHYHHKIKKSRMKFYSGHYIFFCWLPLRGLIFSKSDPDDAPKGHVEVATHHSNIYIGQLVAVLILACYLLIVICLWTWSKF